MRDERERDEREDIVRERERDERETSRKTGARGSDEKCMS